MRALICAAAIAMTGLFTFADAAAEQIVAGVVRDSSGRTVMNASISLQFGSLSFLQTTTDREGKFVFSWETPGSYLLRVHKNGYRDATHSFDLPFKTADPLVISLSPIPQATEGIKFSDKPDFTVAGITDWTAAGGHGSDVNLRASEALASDTRAFSSTLEPHFDPGTEHVLRAAVSKEPSSFEANHALGAFCLRGRHFADAIGPLERARTLKNDDYENSFQLAEAYEGAGEHEAARRLTEQMLHGRDRAELHELLGDIQESLNNPLAAEREYERAVQLEPNEQNYFAWGAELLVHRAVRPAIDVFTYGARVFPKSERMLAALGAALYASGAYELAAQRVCQASDLTPSDPEPYLFLGRMEQAAPRDLRCAEEKLARFARQRPNDALANYYYAIALIPKGAPTAGEAEELLQHAVKTEPKLAEAQLELGVLQSQRGDWESAEVSYEKAAAANPNLPDPHFRLAQLYKRAGDEQKAAEELSLFQRLKQSDAVEVEQRRREIRQFVVVLKNPPAPPAN